MIKTRNNRYIRLKSTLLNSQIQQDNPALYEVINQILEGLQDYEKFTGEVSSEISRVPVIPITPGTGLPSGVKGDLLYHDGDEWQKLTVGTDGQVLSAFGDLPYWTELEDGEDGEGLPPGIRGDLFYHDGDDWLNLGIGSLGNVLVSDGDIPLWGAVGTETEPIRAYIYRNTNQAIAHGVPTAISFDTQLLDPEDVWTSGAPTKIIIPRTGTYIVHAAVEWSNTGFGNFELAVRKNGTEQFRTTLPPVGLASGGGYYGIGPLTVLMNLIEDDELEVYGHWSGALDQPGEVVGGQTRTLIQLANLTINNISIIGGVGGGGSGFQEIIEHGVVGAAEIIDWSLSDKQVIILDTPLCDVTFINPPTDRALLLLVKQDNVGNRKINWDIKITWPYQTVIQPIGITGRMDLFTFIYVPSLDVYVASSNQNYKVS